MFARALLPLALLCWLPSAAASTTGAKAPPTVSCSHCALVGAALASERGGVEQLEDRIEALNLELREVGSPVPARYLVMGVLGFLAGPPGLAVGGVLAIYGGVFTLIGNGLSGAGTVLLLAGAGVALVGLVAVAVLAYALVKGKEVSDQNRERRNQLLQERRGLERELERFRRGSPGEILGQPLFTLLSF